MIVDIHSHYGHWAFSARRDTPASFARVLDVHDIAATIVSSARAIVYDIVSGNAEAADLVRTDKRIFGAAVINPNHVDDSLREIEKYTTDGRFVAAKMHPDYCGVAADAPESMRVLAAVDKAGWPLLLHTWGEREVESAAAVAKAFPKLEVFMFHMGGNAWRTAIERAKDIGNLNLEIVATIPECARIKQAVGTLGAERVFFGTDMTLFTPAYAFGLLDGAGLSAGEHKQILGANALRVFGARMGLERKRI